ncbi:MAG: FtsH protease activity modulator HflK [Steroidobacteraceae bacterium]
MAWNQSGGSKSPWGRRPGQGGADLDERVRGWQRKLESMLRAASPGAESSRTLIPTVVLILIALWLASGFFQVGAAERGVIQRFGRLIEVRSEGWGWRWPWPIETITKVNVMSVASRDFSPSVLTSDAGLVQLHLAVQYRRTDPLKMLFGARDPEEALGQASLSAIREVVGQTSLQDVLTGAARPRLTQRAKMLIQSMLDRYDTGIEVTAVNLTDVEVPDQVVSAQRDANKALADEDRDVKEAQAYASGVVPSAQGDASKIVQDAEAYKTRVVALAQGEAALFTQVAAAYKAAPEVTRERLYLETMEDVFSRANKIVVASKPGSPGGNLLYLPLDKLLGHDGGTAGEESTQPGVPSVSAPSDADTVTVEGRSRGER